MPVRRSDPEEKRKLALIRRAQSSANSVYSISGRVRPEGIERSRKPSMPKMPWDDEPKDNTE